MGKLVLAIIVVLGVAGFAIMQNNSQAEKVVRAERQKIENMNTLVAAQNLNEKWENTFDKTGKYPDGNDLSLYSRIYQGLTRIPPDDDKNYREARALIPKFMARQAQIDKIEFAKLPPPPSDIEIKLGTLDKSYGVLKGDFTLKNNNVFAVADVKIACSIYAPSQTVIKKYDFTIFDVIPAKSSKTIRGHNFGFFPDQGKSVSCSSDGYQKR